eukprot:Anaeramoba_ignava/a614228_8.p1 GENE.a614228_8~~a614228_8.p1  ORF type:complete len:129 (-),score=23.01 a614228_8:245-631(-)
MLEKHPMQDPLSAKRFFQGDTKNPRSKKIPSDPTIQRFTLVWDKRFTKYPQNFPLPIIQFIPDEEKLPTQEETQKLKKKNPTKKRRKTDSISPKSISQPISKDPLITRRKYNLRKKQAPERFQKFQVS